MPIEEVLIKKLEELILEKKAMEDVVHELVRQVKEHEGQATRYEAAIADEVKRGNYSEKRWQEQEDWRLRYEGAQRKLKKLEKQAAKEK